MTEKRRVRAGRRTVDVSNPDKVLFPDDGITKADLVDYYIRVGDVMLPHVRDRPVSMKRYPNGIDGQVFYQKNAPDFFPDWIPRVEVRTSKGPRVHAVIGDRGALAFLANQACIEPHTWTSRADALDHPDLVVFDLDPSADDLALVRKGARTLRAMLDRAGLVPFVKTSGSRGYHVVAPLDRSADFGAVRAFADGLAEVAAEQHPDVFTIEFRKAKRGRLVFLDVMRNGYGSTVIPPYSVRAYAGAPVAVPIEWDELGRVDPQTVTMATLFRRLARRGDPWAGIRRRARALGDPERRLARIRG
ncbi:MAG TPA: non-homologous end-joining DNA ligase [Actinomycetota bacterium]|nr:non-homologous end-joining DNA ligase [Actinomycetota bacterium]